MGSYADVPLPKTMRTLPHDARGYPIPFVILRDKSGTPQFTINDQVKARQCITKKLCAICGKRMHEGFWFVGGLRCFLHERGAFFDPPMHLECAEYALQVCPFLAASKYLRRVGTGKLSPDDMPDGAVILGNRKAEEKQPERFGLGYTLGYRLQSISKFENYFIVDDWRYVEWWKNGHRCNAPESGESPLIWWRE